MNRRRHILVVDDQRDILDLTSSVLAGDGYTVSTARSGVAALAEVEAQEFDLMLLDVNMPEMDGWETLRLVRADDRRRRLPVVMFSIKGEIRDKVQAMQEGALDYITKPFMVDELLLRVRRIFETVEQGSPPPLQSPVS